MAFKEANVRADIAMQKALAISQSAKEQAAKLHADRQAAGDQGTSPATMDVDQTGDVSHTEGLPSVVIHDPPLTNWAAITGTPLAGAPPPLEAGTATLTIANHGVEPLIVEEVSIAGPSPAFSIRGAVDEIAPDAVIEAEAIEIEALAAEQKEDDSRSDVNPIGASNGAGEIIDVDAMRSGADDHTDLDSDDAPPGEDLPVDRTRDASLPIPSGPKAPGVAQASALTAYMSQLRHHAPITRSISVFCSCASAGTPLTSAERSVRLCSKRLPKPRSRSSVTSRGGPVQESHVTVNTWQRCCVSRVSNRITTMRRRLSSRMISRTCAR